MNPVCDYCKRPAILTNGKEVYPHRPDLAEKLFWYCPDCKAWVGVHAGSTRPLGRLANKELRQAKMRAHSAFDPLYQNGAMKRNSAYKWLGDTLGIPRRECHIGMMDVDMCNRVVAACRARAA
jgi:hypothetical protein